MTATTPSTALATIQPSFTDTERLALAGFLAGYRGLTREAYTLDLRQFTGWCRTRSLPLFSVRRADIETFARELEARGRARATVTRRLCTIAGFYKYAVEEELLEHSPAAHARRPRLDYESHATALDRNELGALLVAAGLGPSAEHALISLLALNGLRVPEATGADIEHLGLERGHRTLVITRKGGTVVTIPLAPRTARAIELAVGERAEGPLFLAGDGRRLDRHGAARIVRRVTRRAGIAKHVSPHTLRHAFITAALDAGVPLRDVQEAASHADPRTTIRYDRADEPGPVCDLHRRSIHRRGSQIARTARSAWAAFSGQAELSLGAQWGRSLRATTTAIANCRSGRFGKEAQLIRRPSISGSSAQPELGQVGADPFGRGCGRGPVGDRRAAGLRQWWRGVRRISIVRYRCAAWRRISSRAA
jgi:integrase/recombinase XerD